MSVRLIRFLALIIILLFVVLAARLWQLQVVEGKANRRLAEENRIQRRRLPAPRGLIYDRWSFVLARNEPVYRVLTEGGWQELDREQALIKQAEQQSVRIDLRRVYPGKADFAHLIGYLGEITEAELTKQRLDFQGYGAGSWLGRSGLEQEYESLLRGRDGTELVEVDTQGRVLRQMGQVWPQSGRSLTLAVDHSLQEVAAQELGSRKGAAVATDPQTGEVLLLYSSPSFNPRLFLGQAAESELRAVVADDQGQPLLNRAISGLYPPGSTFKLVTAIAGLAEGKITPQTRYLDTGVIQVGAFSYSNWYYTGYGRTEGEVDLVRALARSTDTYFYKVGEWVGAEKLIVWAQRFGLDRLFGIDLPGEAAGFIGTPEWKRRTRNEPWFLGNTYHLAIGQGDLALTPLGVNLLTAAVVNGGQVCTPRVLKIGAENTPYQAECRGLAVDQADWQAVEQGLKEACSVGGTGWPFFDFTPPVGCKTGTAETGDGQTSHAWISVVAPIEQPEVILTVLVEKGGEGSAVAGPIAKKILTQWFSSRESN